MESGKINMTKNQAIDEIALLSSGTVGLLGRVATYDEIYEIVKSVINSIECEKIDVSDCKNWMEIWELYKRI